MRPLLPLFALTLLIIAGCKDSGKVPGNILPQPKMQAVMWDMMRADQFLSDYVLNKDSSKNKEQESIKLYSRIFAFHKISKEEFEKSFTYYRSNPLQLQMLMDSLSKQKLATPITDEDTMKKLAPVPAITDTDTTKILAPSIPSTNIDSIKKIRTPQVASPFKKDSAARPLKKKRPLTGN
jgi:hypothetical protein